MRIWILFFVLIVALFSCKSKPKQSEYVDYFYPLKGEGQVYIYSDAKNEIIERFHRIYRLEDSKGPHVVVEIYTEDGRIIEAYNYNSDSLNLSDHMIVDRDGKKRQAELFRNKLFPMDKSDQTYFVSRYPGVQDSTLILHEIERQVRPTKPKETIDVMGKKTEVLVFEDDYRFTIFNPITRKENEVSGRVYSYFAKGIGLVRWHDIQSKVDYRLQRIISDEEWMQLNR